MIQMCGPLNGPPTNNVSSLPGHSHLEISTETFGRQLTAYVDDNNDQPIYEEPHNRHRSIDSHGMLFDVITNILPSQTLRFVAGVRSTNATRVRCAAFTLKKLPRVVSKSHRCKRAAALCALE